MKLESVSSVLGFHGSEPCAVKFVKKTEVVGCALKFKILQIGVTKVCRWAQSWREGGRARGI